MADRMKKCSRCGEDIKLAAIKCRYCRADIVERTPVVPTAVPQIAAPKAASHPQRVIADQRATQAHSSSKKGVVAAVAAVFAVATVAVVLVVTSSPNQKPKAPEPLQPKAAPPPADISLEIRSAPSAAVSIGGTGMGTTPLSVRTLRTATPTVVEIRVGGTTFKRTIVPDHDQTIDFGSVAPKKVVAVKRKDTAAGMDMPKECEDYTSAVAKLESCDTLSSETRNALRC